jgi:glycosyltransferase involved in cell wall biosynthesis
LIKKNKKERILFFTDWFYPGFKSGGPAKSILNFSILFAEEIEIFVFTSNKDLGNREPYDNIEFDKWYQSIPNLNIYVYYSSKYNISKSILFQTISEIKPTVVYLNHLWSFNYVLKPLYIVNKYFKEIKIILCPRGALFESALNYKNKNFKKRVVLKLIKFFNFHKRIVFHATTDLEKETIQKHFNEVKIIVAQNLPEIKNSTLEFINKEVGSLKIVFISRILRIKNLLFLLKLLVNFSQKIVLTIAGPIEDYTYWEDCNQIIKQFPANLIINYIGIVKPEEISDVIKKNHLYCLPTLGENFGHSIFESLQNGRPVLISNNTPWQNLFEKKSGWEVSLDDEKKFINCIHDAINWNQEEFDTFCRGAFNQANEYLSNQDLKKGYKNLFFND